MRRLVAISIGFGIGLGGAQAGVVTLDLPQAVERALSQDQRIVEKEKLVEAAQELLGEAKGATDLIYDVNAFLGLAPTVRSGFFEATDESGNKQQLVIPEDFFSTDEISPWYYAQFSVIKPLYTFGKVEHYSRAAASNVKIKEGDVRLTRGEVLLDVTRAYNGFLAARDTGYMLADTLNKLEAALALVEGWLENDEGAAKQSDLFALQTGVAMVQRYQAEAASYEAIALAGLRMLTGVAADDELRLADERLVPAPLPEGTLAALQSRALAQRPESRQLEAGLEARREWMLAKKSESKPNLYTGVVGSISYAPGREPTDFSTYDPFNSSGATPVIGIQWEWASGRQPAQVAQARAEMESTLALKSFAQQGIPFQVAEQYHTVHAYHLMVEKLYEASRSGRRWMIASYADFEAGVEQSDKLISAFLGYLQAYGDYLKTANDYNLHVARLRVVTGEVQ